MMHVCLPQAASAFLRAPPLASPAGWVDMDRATLCHDSPGDIRAPGDVMDVPDARTATAARKQAPTVAGTIVAGIAGRSAWARQDGSGLCPPTVERAAAVLEGFGHGGEVRPCFRCFGVGGTKPRRAAVLRKITMRPPIRGQAMLCGRERMAKPGRRGIAAE